MGAIGARPCRLLVITGVMMAGCGEDAPSPGNDPAKASAGTATTSPSTDTGARADGGVFDPPATQPTTSTAGSLPR